MVQTKVNSSPRNRIERATITRETLHGPRRILVVDDDPNTCANLRKFLESDSDLIVETLYDARKAIAEMQRHTYSVLLTDLRMPNSDGMELIKEVNRRGLPVTIIVMTAFGNVDEAVAAMRMGAYDFLSKPIDTDHLRLVIQRALRERSLRDEVASLREQLQVRYSFHNVLSKSPRMHHIFEMVTNLAHTNTTVLIEGETGTGKEQLARAIHYSSDQRDGPWVAVNCAALPETLLESELFGHEKGSFTSAMGQRKGRFELADGGTIFLDEVGDIPATMQAKLLRVLQERCFERVGGTQRIEVDVRVIAATNRDLHELVVEGIFREDLFYRLNVVRIQLPPLRERPEDIPLLATYFAEKHAPRPESALRITPEAMDVLLDYHWPGNIRELENAIERACVTSTDNIIRRENLPPELLRPSKPAPEPVLRFDRPLKDVIDELIAEWEERYLREALQRTHGDVGRCAKICGMSRRSISAKIAKYNIDRSAYKEPQ